jgi:hypothetical protein
MRSMSARASVKVKSDFKSYLRLLSKQQHVTLRLPFNERHVVTEPRQPFAVFAK